MDRQNIWLLMTVAVVSVIGLVTLQVGMPSLGSENIAGEAIYLSGASASSYSSAYAYATKLNPATATTSSSATTTSVTTTASASSIEESGTGLSVSPEDVIAIVSTSRSTTSCMDTDGGLKPTLAGRTHIIEHDAETGMGTPILTETDYCDAGLTSLWEWRCESGGPKKELVDCAPYGGGSCLTDSDGRAYCEATPRCVDSDDGDYPLIAGKVTIFESGIETGGGAYDTCKSTTMLTEMVCGDKGVVTKVNVDCTAFGGICQYDYTGKPQAYCSPITSCSDSDGGSNIDAAGELTLIFADGGTEVIKDECKGGSTRVYEYICGAGNLPQGRMRACPSGVCLTDSAGRGHCREGSASSAEELAPAPEESEPSEESSPSEGELIAVSVGRRESASAGECTDSDGHLALAQFEEPGYITTDTGTTNDACDSPSLLIEQLCWSGTPTEYPVECNRFLPGSMCLTNAAGIGYCYVDTSVPAAPCSDSDAHLPTGRERFETPGIVTTSVGVTTEVRQFQDSCTGDMLNEQWCMGDSKQVLPFDCTRLGWDYECLMRAMIDGSRVGYCGSTVSLLAVVESGEAEPEEAEEEPEEEEPTETLITEPTLREIVIDWLIFWR